jgi:hypothetical protein
VAAPCFHRLPVFLQTAPSRAATAPGITASPEASLTPCHVYSPAYRAIDRNISKPTPTIVVKKADVLRDFAARRARDERASRHSSGTGFWGGRH